MALVPRQIAPELLSKVTKALGITVVDQWYYVSHDAVTRALGVRTLNKYGGTLSSFLKTAYPSHHFDEEKLALRKNQERDQSFFEVIIRKLFPNIEILTKARKAVGILNPETGAYLEIDFWMPSLKLGIEYQDRHHYEYQWYANATLEVYQKRDHVKKVTMPSLGYTLITIGFWWDRSIESVAATIRKYRPDLLLDYASTAAEPIPSDPPPGYITESSGIPGVAGLMSPFIPASDFSPTNWYAGEKHDGVRGVYNPELNKMFSRSGAELSVIPSFLNDIPDILVEGEVTAGRGNYNKTTAVSFHSHHDKVNWPLFRYVIYDIPDAELGDYTQRYSTIISELLVRPFIFAQPTFRMLISNKAQLKTLVGEIISDAGEGVIVQKDAAYEYGRAKNLAKIKVRRDADAQVLCISEHSCTCKLVTGVTADIPFIDDFDSSHLRVGDIISYYHKGFLQSGKPKQGEIYKVRYDITWEMLIDEQVQKVVKPRSIKEAIGGSAFIAQDTVKHKAGHWNKPANVRAFFDEFAKKAGFDPLSPENWYSVRLRTLKYTGGTGVLNAFGYNLQKALATAYPELKFIAEKIRARIKNGHWNDSANAQAFFDGFAKKCGFDPLMAENWYSITMRALRNAGGSGLLTAYGYSLKKVLSNAYPTLKLEGGRFRTYDKPARKKGHWKKQANVRAFFDDFARTARFDPLVSENWNSVSHNELLHAGGSGILKTYKHNFKNAIAFAYPELKFEDISRARNKIGHWNEAPNVQAFFAEFARTSGFDPLVPENWYSVKIRTLKSSGGSGMLSAYGYKLKNALSRAYPEVRFVDESFRTYDKTKGKT